MIEFKKIDLQYKTYLINRTIDIPICPNCSDHLMFWNPVKFYMEDVPNEDFVNIENWSNFTDHLGKTSLYLTHFHCPKCNLYIHNKGIRELIKHTLGYVIKVL